MKSLCQNRDLTQISNIITEKIEKLEAYNNNLNTSTKTNKIKDTPKKSKEIKKAIQNSATFVHNILKIIAANDEEIEELKKQNGMSSDGYGSEDSSPSSRGGGQRHGSKDYQSSSRPSRHTSSLETYYEENEGSDWQHGGRGVHGSRGHDEELGVHAGSGVGGNVHAGGGVGGGAHARPGVPVGPGGPVHGVDGEYVMETILKYACNNGLILG